MHLAAKVLTCGSLLVIATQAWAQVVPRGTQLEIRTEERIDAREAGSGRIYAGEIARDVYDSDGDLVIRRGARAELIVRRIARNEVAVDLDGITVDGRHYSVPTSDITESRGVGVGANGRTGKFVGGGALFGTIVGALAGGGKGAAIGALAGGAAGATMQTLTRGKTINIPPESILTFRLDHEMTIYGERGYDRGSKHYHRNRDR